MKIDRNYPLLYTHMFVCQKINLASGVIHFLGLFLVAVLLCVPMSLVSIAQFIWSIYTFSKVPFNDVGATLEPNRFAKTKMHF